MNVLNSEISTKRIENSEEAEAEEFSEDAHDTIQRAREEYGRYFGICGSYHHLKACLCRYCSACPADTGMFCARGSVIVEGEKKENCLCETCELFKKFRLEGDYFCQLKEKGEVLERKKILPGFYKGFQTASGKIKVCVLDKQKYKPNPNK